MGRVSAPAKIVSWPSRSTRTAMAAPIRLRRWACKCPVSNPRLEIPTSALGADATTVPSGSRTMISRNRSAARPSSVRSSCVPPTSMRCPPPSRSSTAAVSQGVTMSTESGPLPSRHHNAPAARLARPVTTPAPIAKARRRRQRPADARAPRPGLALMRLRRASRAAIARQCRSSLAHAWWSAASPALRCAFAMAPIGRPLARRSRQPMRAAMFFSGPGSPLLVTASSPRCGPCILCSQIDPVKTTKGRHGRTVGSASTATSIGRKPVLPSSLPPFERRNIARVFCEFAEY